MKVKRWQNTYKANTSQNNAGEIILTSEKVGLRRRNINKDKEDISYT